MPRDTVTALPCAARISSDLSFFADDSGHLYDWTTGAFSDTATPMPSGASQSVCGYAESASGERIVVVAGGYDDRVMLYDLDTGIWTTADAPLPYDVSSAMSVPLGNTFVIVGGELDENYYSNRIMQFDPETKDWIIRPERLQTGRSLAYAALVTNDKVNCSFRKKES